MTGKPRILILNATCLDVAESYRDWIATLDAEIVADPSHRRIDPDRMNEVLAGASGAILPSAPHLQPEHMEACPTLRVLSLASSGFEYVDLDAATRLGIVVTHAPVAEGAEVVADMTWGLMLAVARRIPHHHRLLQMGRYERGMGAAVCGKTLGVVGLGNIGRAVARRACGFDMTVLATEVAPDLEFVRRHGIELVGLDELLRRSDFVSLHLRINDQTRHIISADQLAMMKPTAFLINAARQELVDEAAMAEALVSGQIAGVAMDDPPLAKDSPLLGLPSFVCTPHLGNRAIEGVRAVFECAVRNAVAVVNGLRPDFVLNPAAYDVPPRGPRGSQ
ncbi:MAG: hypothetical protein JXQ73_14125 [Phycisphaerae bacterium]|nr:hypothetical protein [Phycisphaerae bacterium]